MYLKHFEALLVEDYTEAQFIFPLLIVTKLYIRKNYEELGSPPDQFYVNLHIFRERLSAFPKNLNAVSQNLERIIAKCCLKDKITGDSEKKLAVLSKKAPQFPADFQEVLDAAKKIEMKLLIEKNSKKMPSFELSQAAIIVDGAKGDLETLAAQIIRLEADLKTKENRSVAHTKAIKKKIVIWKRDLSERVSDLILDSGNLEELRFRINSVFKDELSALKKIVLSHVEFLENQHFFISFYQIKNLPDKYDYICSFQKNLNEKKMVSYLNVILDSLIQTIIKREFKFITAEKKRLMDLPDSTIENVFSTLRDWASNVHCLRFKRKAIFKVLMSKIDQKQAEYAVWEKLNDEIVSKDPSLPYRTYQPLMRDVYTMRYLKHPGTKPKKPVPKYLLSSSDEDQSDTDSETESDGEDKGASNSMAALSLMPQPKLHAVKK